MSVNAATGNLRFDQSTAAGIAPSYEIGTLVKLGDYPSINELHTEDHAQNAANHATSQSILTSARQQSDDIQPFNLPKIAADLVAVRYSDPTQARAVQEHVMAALSVGDQSRLAQDIRAIVETKSPILEAAPNVTIAATAPVTVPTTASIGGITVTAINGGDPRVIVAELAKLPAEILRNLEQNKVKFVAAGDNVGEVITSGVPRGWPPGSTWNDVKAVYQPSTNTVIYATGPRLTTGSTNTILHETGHALDRTNGNASSKRDFIAAWTLDSIGLKGYYHPTNGTNPNPKGYLSETYAESFSNHFAGNADYANAHPALAAYWAAKQW